MKREIHPCAKTKIIEVNHQREQIQWHASFLEIDIPLLLDEFTAWARYLIA
jgi:hypothetical protein